MGSSIVNSLVHAYCKIRKIAATELQAFKIAHLIEG